MTATTKSLLEQGMVLEQNGLLAEALLCFRQALLAEPTHAEIYLKAGRLLGRLGQKAQVLALYRQALDAGVSSAEIYNNLGNALLAIGKTSEAVRALSRAVSLRPDDPEKYYNLGGALYAYGDSTGSLAAYDQALSRRPDFVEAQLNRARLLLQMGRRPEGEEALGRVLEMAPGYGRAHLLRAMSKRYTERGREVIALEDLHASAATDGELREQLCFALGKINEDLGNFTGSFRYFQEGNRLVRRRIQYSSGAHATSMRRMQEIFQPEFFARHSEAGAEGEFQPLFILGMPRSGTTLVEQILMSHSRVDEAGELDDLEIVIREHLGSHLNNEFFLKLAKINSTTLTDMGRQYLKRVLERKALRAGRIFITDKMPGNFLYLGLIRLMLPAAKVIRCWREPMENCWSLYKNIFQMPHNYSYDLEELGHYYRQYHFLMEHWRKVLPGFFYTARYEDLVNDHEKQTRALVEFCGLPWDAACMAHHKTERVVKTLSSFQVRQPIYRESLQLSRKYGDKLAPLASALGDLAGVGCQLS